MDRPPTALIEPEGDCLDRPLTTRVQALESRRTFWLDDLLGFRYKAAKFYLYTRLDRMMARATIIVFAAWLAWAAPALGQPAPVQARIGATGAVVRGGPDETHYPTGELEAGTSIEIFRLDPGQWCAIRPTPDSFSLVRGDALRWIDQAGGIAEIVAEGEPSWIGTRMGQVEEPMWQVNLQRGERVRVLGAIESASDPALVEWYQIAPPRGEFRWIALSDLDETSHEIVLRRLDANPSSEVQAAPKPRSILERQEPKEPVTAIPHEPQPIEPFPAEQGGIALTGFDEQDAVRRSNTTPSTEGRWRVPQRRRDPSTSPIQTASLTSTGNSFQTPDRSRRFEASPTTSNMPAPTTQVPSRWPASLQALDLRLSQEILKEPAQWQLDGLAHEVRQLRQSCSPQDVVVADHILNKIQQFQLIQSGRPQPSMASRAPNVQGVVAIVGQEAIPMGRDAQPNPMAGMDYSKTFDAYGWLNELVRDEGMGQTTYVLQDDNGKITHLVAATPGLNLHRYLKTKVGIVGQKGFHQQMKLDHVTAERIVSLETERR